MANLGNLHFGLKLGISDQELDDVVEKVQARLERNKIKLGIDVDQSSIDLFQKKIEELKNAARDVSSVTSNTLSKPARLDPVTAKAKEENIKLDEELQRKEEASHRKRLKQIEKEARVVSKQARIKSDAFKIVESGLNYSRTQKMVSLPYEDAKYKNAMNQMRAHYAEEERFAKEYHKAYTARQKEKEKQKRDDAKIEKQLQREENKAQRDYLRSLDRQGRVIQQQQAQKQKALDFQKKQEEAQRKRDDAELERLIRKEAAEKKRYNNMLARSMKNHSVQFTDYDSVEYRNKMNQMREYYKVQESLAKKRKADADSINRRAEKAVVREARELARISREIKRFDNEINKLSLDGRLGKAGGPKTEEAIRRLREYRTELERALNGGTPRKGVVKSINDGRYTAAIQQARQMSREQRALNRQRETAAQAARMQRNEILRLNSAHASEYRLMGQLRNQFMNVYSVYEAERFLRSVIEIGGEFQKQRIALNAMLGDTAKADAMFGKIKELAIESPFNFRDLMGFTKQIAAFGIPYDEMYETTKRLADISAGLGVDMGRIILAYGQVRSAAVLRGQELRQFTEAGIPMVDELAKKFSELEGRVVSAGEVFEKISNREVSFGMVKDILWQMTNEGGRFFEMQEVLTESLSGKYAKLRDSYEMMLGAIADGNNSFLGGSLDLLTKMTSKWEEVWTILRSVIVGYGSYKALMFIVNASTASHIVSQKGLNVVLAQRLFLMGRINASTNSMIAGMSKLNAVLSGSGVAGIWGPIAIASSAILALSSFLYGAYQNATKLNRELESIAGKGSSSVDNEIASYKILVEKLGKAVKGTEEYNNIKQQISSHFGSYIGDLNREADAYSYLKTKIDDVTVALQNKAKNSTRQQMMSTIESTYAEDLTERMKALKQEIKNQFNVNDQQASEIATILKTSLQKQVDSGIDIWNTSFKSITDNARNIAKDLNIPVSESKWKGTSNAVGEKALQLAQSFRAYNKSVKEMDTLLDDSFNKATVWSVVMDRIRKERDSEKPLFKTDREREDYELKTLEMQLEAIRKIAGSGEAQKEIESQIDNIKRLRDVWITTAKELGKKVGLPENSDLLPNDTDKSKRSLLSYFERLRGLYKNESEKLRKYEASISGYSPDEDKQTLKRQRARVKFIRDLFAMNNVPIDVPTAKQEQKDAEKEARERLQAELKSIKDSIAEVTDQWEVFSRVLDKTGNKDLAKTLAFGDLQFGETQMMKDFRKIIEEGIKGVVEGAGGDNPFDLFLGMTDFQIDELSKSSGTQLQLLKPYVDAYKKAQRELRKETADNLTELVVKYKDHAAKIEDIERKKNKDIADIQSNAARLRKDGVDPNRLIAEREKQAEKEKSAVLFEQFKESSNWVKVFDDLDRVSDATLENMIKQVETFAVGMAEGAEETKEVIDALRKLRDEQIERNPWKGFGDAMNSLRFWRKADTRLVYNDKANKFVPKYTPKQIEDGEAEALSNLEKSLNGVINGLDGLVKSLDSLSGMFESLGMGGFSDVTGVLGSGLSGALDMGGGLSKFGQLLGLGGAAVKNMGFIGMGIGAVTGIVGSIAELHDKSLDKSIEKSKARVDELKNAYEQIEESISRGAGELERSLHYYSQLNAQVERIGISLSGTYAKAYSVLSDGGKKYIYNLRKELGKLNISDVLFRGNFSKKLKAEMLAALEDAGVGSNNLTNDMLKQKQAQYVALVEQRSELQRQMRDEDAKKKTDSGKMADYQNQIAELNVQIGSFVEDLAKDLFGIDFDDWSGQISDALVNAFANGEDAAEAFKNVTNGIVRGISNNILKSMVIQPMFEKLQKKLFGGKDGKGGIFETFEDIQNNGELLADALKDFFDSEGNKMIEASKDFLDAMDKASGGAISSTGDKQKEGLSAGIKGVTEDTANLLASYLNSIRANTNAIQGILEKMSAGDDAQMNTIAQAQLQQLSIIAVNTGRNVEFVEEIRDILHRNVNGGNKFHF